MQMNQAFIDRYTLNVVSSIEDQTALLVLDIQNHLTPSDMVPRLLAIQHYVLNALAQLDC